MRVHAKSNTTEVQVILLITTRVVLFVCKLCHRNQAATNNEGTAVAAAANLEEAFISEVSDYLSDHEDDGDEEADC